MCVQNQYQPQYPTFPNYQNKQTYRVSNMSNYQNKYFKKSLNILGNIEKSMELNINIRKHTRNI